ncbi:MAG: HAMP domain-containing histidine kinase [Deltaproteobacteria bacterium]|nr:HAMP domain-containing histidine kinase [Deltaproteobacteria bacterium]
MLKSLAARLLLPLLAVMTLGYAVLAYSEATSRRQDWAAILQSFAERTTTLVANATHHEMLLNRKDLVQLTLQRVGSSTGVTSARIYDPEGRVAFSSRPEEAARSASGRRRAGFAMTVTAARALDDLKESPGIVLRHPIPNTPACSTASCHAHPPEKAVLGILEVRMSTEDFLRRERRSADTRLLVTATLMLLVGSAVIFFVGRFVRRPVLALQAGAREVAEGNLDVRIPVTRDDELGQLAAAFNQMTSEIDKNRRELTAWSAELEERVATKSEEMARVQRHQLEVEKLASLGKLAAVVAHELNNPLGGILTYAKLVERKLARDSALAEDVGRYLGTIQSESVRCGNIVRNLLSFARRGQNRREPVHLDGVVQRTTMLVQHTFDLSGATLTYHPSEGDDVLLGDEGELQQALLALILNAAEAVAPTHGAVDVSVVAHEDSVDVRIRDNGEGIPPDIRPHIFEPFFSTKGAGGTGIGLAVAHGIAQRHAGRIEVESEPGQGATFSLCLPRHRPDDAEPEEQP